jgi:hypothetical protein
MEFGMNEFTALAHAMAADARREIAKARLRDMERPIGEKRLDTGFYSAAERDKPVEDYDFWAHGRHYVGTGSRWAVWRVRWTGSEWQQYRRVSGPLGFTEALTRLTEECTGLGLKRAGVE